MCVHFICDFSALGFRSDRIFNPLDKGGVVYTTTLVGQKNIIVINSLADHYQFLQDQIQPVPARALPLLALLSLLLPNHQIIIANPLYHPTCACTTPSLLGSIVLIQSYHFQSSSKPVLARALPLSALLSFALSSRGELASRNRT